MKSIAILSFFCLSVLGCSPPTLPARPPAAEPPIAENAPIAHRSRIVQSADGESLFRQSWVPREGKPRAIVVVHHGLKDYSDRYGPFATQLAGRGIAVFAHDMRGHGRSAGPRASLPSFDLLVDDLEATIAEARTSYPSIPVFVLGHSVGGAIVSLYAVERSPSLAGVILLAPALRVDRAPIEVAGTPIVAALTANFPVVDVPNDAFISDPKQLAAMGSDPFVYQPAGPASTAGNLLDALGRIWAGAGAVKVPVLAIHGIHDRATDPRGSANFIDSIATSDKKLVLFRDALHDLLHIPEAPSVYAEIEGWIDAHLAPAH